MCSQERLIVSQSEVEGIADAGLLIIPIDLQGLRSVVFNHLGRLGESRQVIVVTVFVIIITIIYVQQRMIISQSEVEGIAYITGLLVLPIDRQGLRSVVFNHLGRLGESRQVIVVTVFVIIITIIYLQQGLIISQSEED